ncbi:MAG TPA: ATP-binding cassette domain-containing protein, partial [Roseiarcus sp.]|nr:ATP-binding cassette domain-containing protein [Roseiarcus sp.]
PGEIVGVAGIGGNGQDELVACAAGLAAPVAGQIVLNGRDLTGALAASFRAAGVGYVSPDRADEGLCLAASIRDNFVAGREREPEFSRFGVMRRSPIDAAASRALDLLSVRFGALTDPAASLSGGNQQRLVLARELEREPRFLIAAQPTRGVDIAGTAFIHRMIAAFRDRGGAVLLVSESLDEILALSDRIVCLYNGKLAGETPRGEASVETLGRMMLGQRAA